MWALIDNYDSFTHILLHYLQQVHDGVRVWKNDEITVEELRKLAPQRIILSPGPQTPNEAGITNDVIKAFHATTPILGICLGHQALGVYFGATLAKAQLPRHGKTSTISVENSHPIFSGITSSTEVMRYHSLVITDTEHTDLQIIAQSGDAEIMAICHKHFHSIGLQFHPESILTKDGKQIIQNWAQIDFV